VSAWRMLRTRVLLAFGPRLGWFPGGLFFSDILRPKRTPAPVANDEKSRGCDRGDNSVPICRAVPCRAVSCRGAPRRGSATWRNPERLQLPAVLLANGETGMRYCTPGGGPGGILDPNGKIVTFWYH
jgi:hypothetical protein